MPGSMAKERSPPGPSGGSMGSGFGFWLKAGRQAWETYLALLLPRVPKDSSPPSTGLRCVG